MASPGNERPVPTATSPERPASAQGEPINDALKNGIKRRAADRTLVVVEDVLLQPQLLEVAHEYALATQILPSTSDSVLPLRQKHHSDSAADADGWTPLTRACDRGDDASMRALLNAGAAIEAPLSSGHTALMLACLLGHRSCVSALLSREAPADLAAIDKAGWTALMFAAHSGHAICASELLVKGADPNCANSDGFTALMVAAQQGNCACILTLLEWSARPDMRSHNGATALIIACEHGHAMAATTLLRKGADAEAEKLDGFTALLAACQLGDAACLRALIRCGAQVNHVGSHGFTAMMLAVDLEHTNCIHELQCAGAMHCACWYGRKCETHFWIHKQLHSSTSKGQ